jgi:hypothetical protein
VQEYLDWLEQSSWAAAIRQSLWMYPALEIVHILGIVLLVGSAFSFDLRLLGSHANLSLAGMSHLLLSWARYGLILIIPSGLLLFITNAAALGMDPTFWLKMMLLIVAGLNALVFHKISFAKLADLETAPQLPWRIRIHALISVMVWVVVIACGRLLAY